MHIFKIFVHVIQTCSHNLDCSLMKLFVQHGYKPQSFNVLCCIINIQDVCLDLFFSFFSKYNTITNQLLLAQPHHIPANYLDLIHQGFNQSRKCFDCGQIYTSNVISLCFGQWKCLTGPSGSMFSWCREYFLKMVKCSFVAPCDV